MKVKILEQIFAFDTESTEVVEAVGKESGYYWLVMLDDRGYRFGYVFTDREDKAKLMLKDYKQ